MTKADQILSWWKEASSEFPEKLPVYSVHNQLLREKQLDQFSAKIKSKTKQAKGSFEAIRKEKAEMLNDLTVFFRQTLDYSEEQVQTILSDEMVKSTWTFMKSAKKFDSTLSYESIFQALRNVWILNGLQLLLGKPVELTSSIFAYSMLYPYTDNYLDDATISTFDKLAFGERFANRLAGEPEVPQNRQEEKIYEMVELIEGEWSRELYPDVYQSLLEIHAAQSESVFLLEGVRELSFEKRLEICIHKGGTSVVADGYLLVGNLTGKQETFLYAYGAYLQLLDDFQDLSGDLKESVLTAFAFAAKREKLDLILNRTFHLGQQVIEQAEKMQSDQVPVFQSLMQKSIELFLVEAVQANSRFFSPEYVLAFDRRSPISFDSIEKKTGTFSPYQNQLFERLIQQALNGEPDEEFPFLQKTYMISGNLQQG